MHVPVSLEELVMLNEYNLFRATLASQTESPKPPRKRPHSLVRKMFQERKAQRRRLGEKERADACPICLECNERKLVRTLPCCGKVVHATCVDTWLGKHGHSNCPLCRHVLFEDVQGDI